VLLQQDNAPAHTSRVALAAAAECGFEIIPHPPYSPDLAPSDYHLFSNLKRFLRGRRFTSDEELKSCVETWFSGLPADFYETGLNALKKRWQKCIALQGEYVEK
jgi:histone-lysine N-methyltransferase SETMAR